METQISLEAKKILLVDNDSLLRKLRALILKQHGFHVYPALNLTDARERCKPGAYDLVIMNTANDSKAGLEFCKEIRTLNPKQKIIILTEPHVYVPSNSCPDKVAQAGPEHLIQDIQSVFNGAGN